jgi:N-acetylmuramate 1-kinase
MPIDDTATPTPAISWSDPKRQAGFLVWLQSVVGQHGLLPATLRPASADASFRRYFRIDQPASAQGSLIIMDAPPDKENCHPFVKVAQMMQAAGLHVPRILNWDEAQGFLLLTDLGPHTLMSVLNPRDASANLPRYQQALDALLRWQLASQPDVLPAYDAALLQRELALFSDWYLGQHRGVALDDAQRHMLADTCQLIVKRNLSMPSVFVHRDFMPRNLIVASEHATEIGVLDFQDAVYGPITYDIASLMRDAFHSWEEDFVLDVTIRYWEKARRAGLPVGEDFGEFYRHVDWMSLQRHLKVAGIFARLTLRDGKPAYLADTPRFISYIRATASRYRELTPLLRLIDRVEGLEGMSGFAFGRV